MLSKNTEKNIEITLIENSISNVFVTNNSRFKPYIEVFHYTPENISLQNLGELVGFFKINDFSDDSAYIVNFLTSVLNKEYFANPKRSISNSFDIALHKVNLALAELAKHDNISWLGKIEGAACVLEKNNLHFSITGKAKILLFRNQTLADIGENTSEQIEPNPLKTFTDVSSGRLQENDKIIVSSQELFEIFSLNEIKKASLRFSQDNFFQFINTALVNETDIASTIIIDSRAKKIEELKIRKKKNKETKINAFSEKTFREKLSKKISDLTKRSAEQKNKGYTDKKTGHIYIQGEQADSQKISIFQNCWIFIKEKSSDFCYRLKKYIRKFSAFSQKNIAKVKQFLSGLIAKKIEQIKLARKTHEKEAQRTILEQGMSEKDKPIEEKQETEFFESASELKIIPESNTESEIKNESPFSFDYSKILRATADLFGKIKEKMKLGLQSIARFISKYPFKEYFGKIIPDFSKIKKIFSAFDYQQRLYAFLILLLIIIAPLIFIKMKNEKKIALREQKIVTEMENQQQLPIQENKLKKIGNPQELASSQNFKNILWSNFGIFAITDTKIIVFQNDTQEETILPESVKNFSAITYMDDLNLIFFLTDKNTIMSFSPVSKSFQENAIDVPQNAKIPNMATYLTYLYLIDSNHQQIYRYPRAEGGFGNKTDWLKDQMDLSGISQIGIDENIYLPDKNRIFKFFKGRKQEFSLESTTMPLSINKLYTSLDNQFIYILDKENSRIVQYQKDGTLFTQYTHLIIGKSIDFSVDEKNQKIYLVTPDKLLFFSIQ